MPRSSTSRSGSARGSRQLDLFSVAPSRPAPAPPPAPSPCPGARALADDALLAALARASARDCEDLAREAVRRGLPAVPALEALCRSFRGFSADRRYAEQTAALEALAAIGGRDAERAVSGMICDGAIGAPGMPHAIGVAVRLRCKLPAGLAAELLRHEDPSVRAGAAACAPQAVSVQAVLAELLTDLHPQVATAAALALARCGDPRARPVLLHRLARAPDAETSEAAAAIADDAVIVLLGRVAASRPDLFGPVCDALADIDGPRADAILARLKA